MFFALRASRSLICIIAGAFIIFGLIARGSVSKAGTEQSSNGSDARPATPVFAKPPTAALESIAGNRPRGAALGGPVCNSQSTLTQSTTPGEIETGTGIYCGGGVSAELSLARSFVMPMTFQIGCVTFGIEGNLGGAWPVEVRLRVGNIGGPYGDLITVAADTVVVPNGGGNSFYTAEFPGGAKFNAGETVVVELFTASRLIADGGDGGLIVLGCNDNGQTAPTYVHSVSCSAPDFLTTDQVGFPQSQVVMTLSALPAPPNCADAIPEGEPCGVDINNGCHSVPRPLHSGIECNSLICGELSVDAGGSVFDVDWYTLNLTAAGLLTKVTASIWADMPVHLFIANSDCNDIRVLRAGSDGYPRVACICLPPGVYRVFPTAFVHRDSVNEVSAVRREQMDRSQDRRERQALRQQRVR